MQTMVHTMYLRFIPINSNFLMNRTNQLQNFLKYLTIAKFSMHLYKLLNQTDNAELAKNF